MSNRDRRPTARRGLVVLTGALALGALLTLQRTEAAGEDPRRAFDPVRQRAETVELLRSIDARLATLVQLAQKNGGDE